MREAAIIIEMIYMLQLLLQALCLAATCGVVTEEEEVVKVVEEEQDPLARAMAADVAKTKSLQVQLTPMAKVKMGIHIQVPISMTMGSDVPKETRTHHHHRTKITTTIRMRTVQLTTNAGSRVDDLLEPM